MLCRGVEISPEWITDDAGLARAARRWGPVVGIDTEFQRTSTFFPLPGLYQIVSGEEIYLLDPLAISRWEPLVEVLEDPAVTLIMHACGEDLELMSHHLGASPTAIFDTQLAHAFVSTDFAMSYTNLVAHHLGVELGKAQTRSNWLRRPLSAEQVRYACEDVAHLPALHGNLVEALAEHDRLGWFEDVMASHGRYQPVPPDEYYRNIKKAWRLKGADLAVLRLLAGWRERTAMAEDVPRNRVVWDEHLLSFAQRAELDEDGVRELLPRAVARRYAASIVAEHQAGRRAPPLPRLERPLDQRQGEVSRQLRDIARGRAEKLEFSQELLARKRDVERCIRHFCATGELSADYRGWRGDLVGDAFEAALERLR